jgi:hypothetical protein
MPGRATINCLSKALQCEKIFINIFSHLILDLKTGRRYTYMVVSYTENCTGIILYGNQYSHNNSRKKFTHINVVDLTFIKHIL